MLDARKPKSPRMFFVSDAARNVMNQTVRLDKNVLFQKSMFVYIKVRSIAPPSMALAGVSVC